ncbi:hypothetical protein [Aromatoleum petrolei]|uniref:NosL family protein n=1 Tax=Aromatoleum petrolei TaxID=76116 RepID=A0ABX1MT98_9RHOO|nr:hypothetical protein [Aromatoleum petrolei]NMF90978.1 hypothetical protein [Aromatoleum petrolei]QTQ36735.1 Uncharacterized protein ToN1_25960 [Aromatoleum petrolei]
MLSPIQRTELRTYYYTPVHCPFCGTRVMGADPADETRITACAHTLFIAHDTAFEYRSERFDRHLDLDGLTDEEVEERWSGAEGGVDGFTNRVTLADAIKVAAYAPAPSAYGSYYGFAPTE